MPRICAIFTLTLRFGRPDKELRTDARALLPAGSLIEIDALRIEPTFVQVRIRSVAVSAECPVCGVASRRVHSRYPRVLRDLPWRGTPVQLLWSVRRFFCDNVECGRRVFAERLSELARRHAQSTPRFSQTLARVGLEAGGEPGARLSLKLGIVTSGDTILRRLRAIELKPPAQSQVIGIDDFAFRKGRTYGTIVVDHGTGRPVELLDQRDAGVVRQWLSVNSLACYVTRDRAGCYATAVTGALPKAVQVADRWHLLANARTVLITVLGRHHQQIRAVAQHLNGEAIPMILAATPMAPNKEQLLSLDRRQRRIGRYEEVLELERQGKSQREIGRRLNMNTDTVRKHLRAGVFTERAKTVRSTLIDPHVETLRQWWDAGDHNARSLHRRLAARGFKGGEDTVRRCVASWRTPQERERLAGPRATSARTLRPRPVLPSPNRMSWLLIEKWIKRSAREARLLDHVLAAIPPIQHAREAVLSVGRAIRERSRTKLAAWKADAVRPTMPPEIRSFAESIERDWAEVSAAVDHSYSNGRTEGHVNRLKLIKRKMYGRANFDLLRIRVLASGP